MNCLLLSGGIDSTALAVWRKFDIAITIDYGQLSALGEIKAAAHICDLLRLKHEVVKVDCRHLGSGDLAGESPVSDAPAQEWWPYRNQLLITIAAMRGFAFGVQKIAVGSVKSDSFHVDGTENFYVAVDALLELQERRLRVEAPALALTSLELVKESGISIELLAWTHSCHRASLACGNCRGCWKRLSILRELGYE